MAFHKKCYLSLVGVVKSKMHDSDQIIQLRGGTIINCKKRCNGSLLKTTNTQSLAIDVHVTARCVPSADLFKKGCCQLQAKVCAQITG